MEVDLFKNKNIMIAIMAVLGFVFSIIIVFDNFNENMNKVKIIATENSYNMAYQSIKYKDNDEDVINEFLKHIEQNFTAQVGALKTICDNNPERFKLVMTDNAIYKVCGILK